MCRKHEPEKLIIAAPVSGKTRLTKLSAKADELVILEKREHFFAVSEGYREFTNLSDSQVLELLKQWQQYSKKGVPPEQ
jgi:predicted phosphoribosyltransferase